MAFIARVSSLATVSLLGLAGLSCGQVAGATGGDGTAGDGSGGDGPGVVGAGGGAPRAARGNGELPQSSDRFAFAKGGQRLQALGYLSDDAAQFRTFHDQLLDIDCEFISGKVCGDLRCAPKLRTDRTELIFLDAKCSEPATWILFQNAQVGDWVSIGPAFSPCPGQTPQRETFELGEEVFPESNSGPAPLVYEWRGTTCAPAFPPAKSIPAVNRLIRHADSELVAARPVSFDVGGGLYLSRLLGEDGSELTISVTAAAGVACAIQATGECIPLDKNAAPPFPMTQRIRQGSGAAHIDLFTSAPGAGSVGVPVALFPEAVDFLDDAGNRCQVVPAVDGTLRCAMTSPAPLGSGSWADAACTRPVYYDYPSGADPSRLRVALYEGSALSAVSTVQVYEGPTYFMSDGGCRAATPDESSLEWVRLILDQRTEASAMPLVFETTL
jgi:hypothetical protein